MATDITTMIVPGMIFAILGNTFYCTRFEVQHQLHQRCHQCEYLSPVLTLGSMISGSCTKGATTTSHVTLTACTHPMGGEGYPTHRFSLLLDIKVLNVTLGALAVDVQPLHIDNIEVPVHDVEQSRESR